MNDAGLEGKGLQTAYKTNAGRGSLKKMLFFVQNSLAKIMSKSQSPAFCAFKRKCMSGLATGDTPAQVMKKEGGVQKSKGETKR